MTPAPARTRPPRTAPTLPHRALPLIVCLLLYAVDLAAVSTVPAAGYGYAAHIAVPFDLMVCVPAAFYLLVVRRYELSPLLVLPVIWLGGFVSSQFAVPGQPSLLLPLGLAALAVEAAIAVHEIRRFLRAYRAARAQSDDPLDWFAGAFFALVRNERASRMAGLECAMWYYVLGSWRRGPIVPEGYRAFSYHRRSGHIAVVGVLLGAVAVETVAVHLLVAQWSVAAAVALTALSLYTALWMVADTRAVVLNPLLVGDGELVVRWGMLTRERIPLSRIERIVSSEPDVPKAERADFAAMGARECWIELSEPVEIRGIIGKPRRVRAIKVGPDDASAFKQAVLHPPEPAARQA